MKLRDICGDSWPLVDLALSDESIADIDALVGLYCDPYEGTTIYTIDLADAFCWLAHDWGGSQGCPIRAAASSFGFSPGACADGPEEGLASEIYAIVDGELSRCTH